MKVSKFALVFVLLLSPCPVFANEWPVYAPPDVSDPTTPTPPAGNNGNGILTVERIAPNEKTITESDLPENWTIEFLDSTRFTLSSDRTGYEGTFVNTKVEPRSVISAPFAL